MVTYVKTIGILIAAFAVLYLIAPVALRDFLKFISRGKRLYLAACLRIAFAAFFFVAAGHCAHSTILIIITFLFLADAMIIFFSPLNKLKDLILWTSVQSKLLLRTIALFLLIIGIVVIISA